MSAIRMSLLSVLTLMFAVNLTAQNISLEVYVYDHYTDAPLDSALVKIIYDGMIIDSSYTTTDGKTQLTIKTTGVEESQLGIPTTFSMSENFPNPFRDETQVNFSIPGHQTLHTEIYNILGQQVLSKEHILSPGYYTMNLSLSHLPTGIYFLRLRGAEQQTIKLMKVGSDMLFERGVPGRVSIHENDRGSGRVPLKKAVTSYGEYTIQVEKHRYGAWSTVKAIEADSEINVPLERRNEVVFLVEFNNRIDFNKELHLTGVTTEDFRFSFVTPDTLILKSGLYSVDGETDTTWVYKTIEIPSIDTVVVLDAIPGEIQTLEPGDVVVGVDGLVVAAPGGALEEMVEIRVYRADDPTVDIPLPDYLDKDGLIGNFYELTASHNVITPNGEYLLVGLPVPEGIPTANLAIAVLSPPESIISQGELEPWMRWSIVTGSYDEESGRFGAVVPFVGTESHIYVLIEGVYSHDIDIHGHNDDNSLKIHEHTTDIDDSRFLIYCIGFTNAYPCTEDHRQQTKDALNEMYQAYVIGLGYKQPHLRKPLLSLQFKDSTGWAIDYTLSEKYEYQLHRTYQQGWYKPGNKDAVTGFPGGKSSPRDDITRHEFFHSLQFAYDLTRENFLAFEYDLRVPGVIEGTATSVQSSVRGLTWHSDRWPMRISTLMFRPGEADHSDYQTQDFWLYVGKVMNRKADYFIPVFEKGGLRPQIDDMLRKEGTFSSLGHAYWQWAKNQSFEKNIIIGDLNGEPVPGGAPCALYEEAAVPDTIYYSPNDWENADTSFILFSLESTVLSITFESTDASYDTEVVIHSESDAVKAKFYFEHEANTINCRGRWDNNSHTFSVDNKVTAHVLVSNTHPDNVAWVNFVFGEPAGIVTDIDGNAYKTIKIGTQWWTAENLRVSRYNNGDTIENLTTLEAWSDSTVVDSMIGAWAYYENSVTYNKPYGKLYNWYAVGDPRGLCPAGWHVPTNDEWAILTNFLGNDAGGKMKSITGWADPNIGATNESGWSGLPGGIRSHTGVFSRFGLNGYWWTSTEEWRPEYDDSWYVAIHRRLDYGNTDVLWGRFSKPSGFSVRCVRD